MAHKRAASGAPAGGRNDAAALDALYVLARRYEQHGYYLHAIKALKAICSLDLLPAVAARYTLQLARLLMERTEDKDEARKMLETAVGGARRAPRPPPARRAAAAGRDRWARPAPLLPPLLLLLLRRRRAPAARADGLAPRRPALPPRAATHDGQPARLPRAQVRGAVQPGQVLPQGGQHRGGGQDLQGGHRRVQGRRGVQRAVRPAPLVCGGHGAWSEHGGVAPAVRAAPLQLGGPPPAQLRWPRRPPR
jgi:hypothetical protein